MEEVDTDTVMAEAEVVEGMGIHTGVAGMVDITIFHPTKTLHSQSQMAILRSRLVTPLRIQQPRRPNPVTSSPNSHHKTSTCAEYSYMSWQMHSDR